MKKILSRLFGRSLRGNRDYSDKKVNGIYEYSDFQRLIQIERDRVHRNERQFSIILIELNGNRNHFPLVNMLYNKISKRVRRIDQIGWYDDKHLGILLPETPLSGAKVIAKTICENCESQQPIGFEILSYP